MEVERLESRPTTATPMIVVATRISSSVNPCWFFLIAFSRNGHHYFRHSGDGIEFYDSMRSMIAEQIDRDTRRRTTGHQENAGGVLASDVHSPGHLERSDVPGLGGVQDHPV